MRPTVADRCRHYWRRVRGEDCPATCYKHRLGHRGWCRHCGDGTDDEDPTATLCQMCAKAGRT